MIKMTKKILSILILCASLQACIGAFIVGSALGGMVVYEGRNLDTQRRDIGLASEINKKLSYDREIVKHAHVVVSAYDGVVLLAGQCPTESMREKVYTTAQTIPGIKRLYNEITISGPISAITQSSDTVITTKVRSMLLAEKDLDSSQIKVVTENGIVYLMGKVTHEQAQVTIDITRTVGGVQKVVTLFEYKAG